MMAEDQRRQVQMESDCKSFWARASRLESMRSAIQLLDQQKKINCNTFTELVRDTCEEEGLGSRFFNFGPQTIRRFINGGSPLKGELKRTGFCLTLFEYIQENYRHNETIMNDDKILEFNSLHSKLTTKINTPASNKHRAHGVELGENQRARTPLESVPFSKLANLLRLDAESQIKAEDIFFKKAPDGEAQPIECHFLTYRYTTKPGEVLKSFTSISRAGPKFPIATFNNFHYVDRVTKKNRESNGAILLTKNHVYMFGSIDEYQGLKIICFDRLNEPLDLYPGLIMTLGEEGKPASSRLLMKRTTEFKHHDEANTGIFAITELIKNGEIKQEELKFLRNTVRSKLVVPLYKKGRRVNQNDLRSHLSEVIMANEDNHVHTSDNEVFDPFDESNIPFNSALEL